MNLVRTNPFRELHDMQETFNRFFGNLRPRTDLWEEAGGNWSPAVDIVETDSDMLFTIEVPGFEKDDIDISFNNGVLSVSGERKFEETEGRNYRRVERWYGKFFRSFQIPSTVDAEHINASLKNGLLTLTLPKREEAKPRQIPVSIQ